VTEHLFHTYTRFSSERLKALAVPDEIATFLSTSGLPTWCAPSAHFGIVFGLGGEPDAELPLRKVGSRQYLGIGEDQDDDLIALELHTHDIWVLPAQREPVYFASDVYELSLSLHEFQSCINSAVEADSQAFLQNRIPLFHLESFVLWAKVLNSRLVQQGTFWGNELVRLGMPSQSLEPMYFDRPPHAAQR
jgi:hypothetical protein